MRIKVFAAFLVLCLASVVAYSQTSFAGKWQTDDIADVQSGKVQARVGQTMIMDLKLDGTKATGSINEIGNGDPLTIESGTLDVATKTLTLITQPRGVTWTITLTDDNTMTVTSRAVAGGGRGAGTPGAGGLPAGGPPAAGGAPADGPGYLARVLGAMPPGAGGAPAAAPAAPAGGQGAGRGAPGGGRGAAAPLILHRVK